MLHSAMLIKLTWPQNTEVIMLMLGSGGRTALGRTRPTISAPSSTRNKFLRPSVATRTSRSLRLLYEVQALTTKTGSGDDKCHLRTLVAGGGLEPPTLWL